MTLQNKRAAKSLLLQDKLSSARDQRVAKEVLLLLLLRLLLSLPRRPNNIL